MKQEKPFQFGPEPVVILVDDRKRDLMSDTLIALHLRSLGVECYLEPLEAFRAVVGAHRPGMIIFNHLTASHLMRWSQRVAKMGILTAVLLNEGILYDEEELQYNSGRFHKDAHIDYYFCWNEPHRQTLLAEGFGKNTKIEVIGVPRFDFYHEPWSRTVYRPTPRVEGRPRILVCTNFVTARYFELPKDHAERLFAQWKDRMATAQNYWASVETHWKGRAKVLDYVDQLVAANKYEVVLRPHPREDVQFYRNWYDKLTDEQRKYVRLDATSNISAMILNCDLEISCETCTTAIESWIAGKPTIELLFEQDPLWWRELHTKVNVPCKDPSKLVSMVDEQLNNPLPSALREARKKHLETWCHINDANASLRMAQIVNEAVRSKAPTDWSMLDMADHRRSAKLKTYNSIGQAYHFDPLLFIKRRLWPKRYAIKHFGYTKSVMPRDVVEAKDKLERAMRGEITV